MKLDFQSLSNEETRIISAVQRLHEQGIAEAAIDYPEHFRFIFPNGISREEYNNIVPSLVEKGFIESRYSSPRDGPLIKLTKAAIKQLK